MRIPFWWRAAYRRGVSAYEFCLWLMLLEYYGLFSLLLWIRWRTTRTTPSEQLGEPDDEPLQSVHTDHAGD